MKKTQKTSLPIDTPKTQRLAARLVHLGMYGVLGVIAITGLAIGFIFWLGLKDGVLIETVVAIHELAIPLMYWLIAIHISAAIYHRLLNDGVWNSMVPFWKEK
jgi:cytochrome b561